jgi:hypothetical protein
VQAALDASQLSEHGNKGDSATRTADALTRVKEIFNGLDDAERRLNDMVKAGRSINHTLLEEIRRVKSKVSLIAQEEFAMLPD